MFDLNLVGDVEIFIAGAGATTFAVSYASFFNWRKTPAGRALMYFVLSLVALFVLNALGRWSGGDYFAREWIRFTVYTALVFTVWHLVWVLWRNWRSGASRPLDIESKPRMKEYRMSHVDTTVPPIWFPSQRVIRSTIQAVIGAVPTVVAIIGILAAQWPTGWLIVTLAAGVAIQSVLTKIMALPKVNEWLTGVGAGSVPKSALQAADGAYDVSSL